MRALSNYCTGLVLFFYNLGVNVVASLQQVDGLADSNWWYARTQATTKTKDWRHTKMKKTLTAAAVCAIVSPVASLSLTSQAGAAEGTNVSVGGYVRAEFASLQPDVGDTTGRFAYRTRLQFDANTDTSLGKLRSQLRVQADNGGGQAGGTSDADAGIDRALISLGNFRLGYSDSWQTTFHGYGNSIERQDGDYGFDQAFFIDYAGTVGSISYGIGIQDTDFEGGDTNTDFDPYFGIGFDISSFGIAASYLQDTENGEGQFKLSANTSFSGFDANAWYRAQSGPNRYSAGAAAGAPADNASFGGSVKFAFSDAVALGVGYSANDLDDSGALSATLFWDPVAGMNVRPEINIYENDDTEFSVRVYRRF